jgi:hypothetical protein
MKPVIYEQNAVAAMIAAGKKLLLAGDEKALSDLPPGAWIAGTIPYFMGEQGGVFTQDHIYVTELPPYVLNTEVKIYDESNIHQIYNDAPQHGFSVIIIPASCPTHFAFALKAPRFTGFASRPLIGWIAGTALNEQNVTVTPRVFDGTKGRDLTNGAVVLHVELPDSKQVEIDIVNIFEQGDGDTITFPEDGFSATKVMINGQVKNIADYLLENAVDTRLPLVADLYGAMINTSFQSLDFAKRQVNFYAPVFAGFRYKIAKPVGDYVSHFLMEVPDGVGDNLFFACNCILNYLYAGLEGRKTAHFTGPITFGEIAYQLLNQTMAYLTIEEA